MTDPVAGPGAEVLVAAWAARVRANREQAERVREAPDCGDFYAPVSGLFVADPRRSDDPALDALREIARPDETWLDIGAGAGRYALPLALRVGEVIALDPSAGMLDALRDGMERHGIRNIRPIHARWPMDPRAGAAPRADVALIAHLGYDVEAIGAFLDAMEVAAGRLCVAVHGGAGALGAGRPVLAGRPRRAARRAAGSRGVPGDPASPRPRPLGDARASAAARVRFLRRAPGVAAQPDLRRHGIGRGRAPGGGARAADGHGRGCERPPCPGDRVEGRRRQLGAPDLTAATPGRVGPPAGEGIILVDPVCGTSVDPAGARHIADHGDRTHAFCRAGCRTRFAKNPARYLALA